MKKKEQLAKEKVEEKRKRMERLEKEENEENRQQRERAKETKDKNHHYDHPNVSTPLGKKFNTVLPTEYYEMTD